MEAFETVFSTSWDWIDGFYKRFDGEVAEGIRSWIKEMRVIGYDRKFRAGQSLYSLMLSRSEKHGLREDQAFILFDFTPIMMDAKRVWVINDILTELKDKEKGEDERSLEQLMHELSLRVKSNTIDIKVYMGDTEYFFKNRIGDFSDKLKIALTDLEEGGLS